MDRINSRIAQVYGYMVCLICVIVILVAARGAIDAMFDYTNPARASTAYGRPESLVSYEAYRLQARQSTTRGPDGRPQPRIDSTVSDADLRRMFDSERNEQMESTRFRALRSLVSDIVFLILATTMFQFHWRWIRRTNAEPAGI